MTRPQVFFIIPTIYLIVGFALFIFQKKLIYHPDDRKFEDCRNLAGDQIKQDGFRGYLTKAGRKLAIVYHGNAGNACDRVFYAQLLLDYGYSTLLVEYPGYAADGQQPDIKKILATTSIASKIGRDLSPEKTIIIGESLGSGVAAYHAQHESYDRLILITPFDSVLNVAQRQFPIFPVRWILTENFDTLAWAKNVSNVRILAAENDEVVPNSHAKNLFDGLITADKKMVMIHGVGHNTIFNSPKFAEELVNALP